MAIVTTFRHSGAVAVVAMATVMVVLVGCGSEDDSSERAETRSSSATGEPSDAGGQGTVPEDATPDETAPKGSATTTAPAATRGSDVLASIEAELASSPADATPVLIRLEVLSMRRLAGGLVEARFRVTNVGDGADLMPFASFRRGSAYDVSGAAIIDLLGGRRYEVLADSGTNCLCSTISIAATVPPGGSASYYARFGAPPEGTDEVDFELPGFPPVSVPLGSGAAQS